MKEQELVLLICKLKPSEAIDLLIEVNKNPVTILDQQEYSKVVGSNCYGCSATNALLKLAKITEEERVYRTMCIRDEYSEEIYKRYKGFIKNYSYSDYLTIALFENAINELRLGHLALFGYYFPYLRERGITMCVENITIIGKPKANFPLNDYAVSEIEEKEMSIVTVEKTLVISNVSLPFIGLNVLLDQNGIEKLNNLKQLLRAINL